MPGAMIYISEFQNKLAWKFDISVTKGQRTQPGNKRVPTPNRSFLALLAGWQLLSPTVSFPFTVGVCVARGCSTWVNTRSDARRHVIARQLRPKPSTIKPQHVAMQEDTSSRGSSVAPKSVARCRCFNHSWDPTVKGFYYERGMRPGSLSPSLPPSLPPPLPPSLPLSFSLSLSHTHTQISADM